MPNHGRQPAASATRGSDDDDDDFLYRYTFPFSSSPSATAEGHSGSSGRRGGGSGGLAPSKSTVYVSNLDYSLTNSDLHTLFSAFGKVARVTVLKDRVSRRSRGVAFALFVSRADASAAVTALHGKLLNGRTLSASIAADNGRTPEFIRRRVYRDKSRCYECGEPGHLSYDCPRNQLGPRQQPLPSKRSRGGAGRGRAHAAANRGRGEVEFSDGSGDDVLPAFEDDNWASVVDARDQDEKATGIRVGGVGRCKKSMKEKKTSYFSDESGEED